MIQVPFPTSADAADMLVQQFKDGVVALYPKYGPVAVESGVYERWCGNARVQRLPVGRSAGELAIQEGRSVHQV